MEKIKNRIEEIKKEEVELSNKANALQNQLSEITAQRIRLAGAFDELQKLATEEVDGEIV